MADTEGGGGGAWGAIAPPLGLDTEWQHCQLLAYCTGIMLLPWQVETEETENGNGKLKRKAETGKLKIGSGRQECKRIEHALS